MSEISKNLNSLNIKKEKIAVSELKRQVQVKEEELAKSQKEKMDLENGYKQQFAKLAHENALLKEENRALKQTTTTVDESTLSGPAPKATPALPLPSNVDPLVTKSQVENYLDKRLKDLAIGKTKGSYIKIFLDK